MRGSVKISSLSVGGKEIVFATFNAGDIFGEIAVLDGEERSADATAMTECELLVLNRRDFLPVLERLVARDLAPDVADHAAQPNAQKLERAPGPLELMGMRVAPDHDRGTLGDAPVALPQRHVVAPREIDQSVQGAVA